jgi:hypothetical protein
VKLKTFFPLLISIQSVAFSHTEFYTTLYFVKHRNYETLANAGTRLIHHALLLQPKRNNFTHSIVYKEGLGYLSVCAVASRSSPPPPMMRPLQSFLVLRAEFLLSSCVLKHLLLSHTVQLYSIIYKYLAILFPFTSLILSF